MCCLVFVVRLEFAQALGLSVCRCGAGSGNSRPGPELRGDCVNTFVKVARLKMLPDLGPPRVSSCSVGPSYPFFLRLTYEQ